MKKLISLIIQFIITSLIFAQSVEIKDSSDETLLIVNDEGADKSSITIPNSGTAPTLTTSKLYNQGGVLKWGPNILGFRGSYDGDWTISPADNDNIYSTLPGNVGIGTTLPVSKLAVNGNGNQHATIYGKTVNGYGVEGEASGLNGRGIKGTSNSISGTHWGGWFEAHGIDGIAVAGHTYHEGDGKYGGHFTAAGISGRGVYAQGSGTDSYGVYATSSGIRGVGIYGETTGEESKAIHGYAYHNGDVLNYGGYFESRGMQGKAVYGKATNATGTAYGGHFQSSSITGRGALGLALGSEGIGLQGWATHANGVNFGVRGSTDSPNGWAGYFNGRGYFSGKVGIGTTDPSIELDIISSQVDFASRLRLGNSDKTHTLYLSGGHSGQMPYISFLQNDALLFSMYDGSNNELMRITSDGYVGIGTETPTSKLQVVGIPGYATDVAAGSAGLTAGAIYQTNSHATLPNGVLMVKQ